MAQNSVELKTPFPDSALGRQLSLVSKMIGSKHCRGSNKDLFFIRTGKFDHHRDVIDSLKKELDSLNDGLKAFVTEIKSLPNNVWNDVVIVVTSEFGR